MLKYIFLIIFSISIVFATNPRTTYKSAENTQIAPGRIVVKYKKVPQSKSINDAAKTQRANKYGLSTEKAVFSGANNIEIKHRLNLQNVFVYEVPVVTDIFSLAEKLNNEESVEYAEPVYLSRIEETPNDPLYNSQQYLPQVAAPEAWDDQYGSSSVIIGVIDTGVDWDHEDLENIIWTNPGEIPDNGIDDDGNGYVDDIRGYDFVDNVSGSDDTAADPNEDGEDRDNDPMDYDGHGTHVSGIAAAETNNNIGIASVASGALIMPLRCGWHANDGLGYVASDFAAEAYIYAADNGADITNQSSGSSGQLIVDGAFYALLNGVLIVESAGNSNNQISSSLGAQPWVISVASLNSNDSKSSFSNYGEYIDVSAPGSNILSTVVEPSGFYGGSRYVQFSGTSMAAPLVASVAGLVKAKYPGIHVIDLYTKVVETADNIDAQNPSYVGLLGSGRVNAARALSESVTAYPRFEVVGTSISETLGNSNGILEPGEEAILNIEIENMWAEGSNISATLTALDNWPITITDNSANIASIASLLDTANSKTVISFSVSCDPESFPSTVSMQLELTGTNFNQTIDFELGIDPQILFVADFEEANGGEFDFSSFYFEDFATQRIAYDYAHTSTTDITYDLLSKYNIVVWSCEWAFPSLTASDRDALKQYLDNGGALFLSGQDIGWELNESTDNVDISFFNNYLKANYLSDDAGKNEIFGVDGDPISDGLYSEFYQIRRDAANQYPDEISPIGGAESIFEYSDGTAGALKYSGDYDLVYFAFGGYESILDDEVRREILNRIIKWFAGVNYTLQEISDTENIESPITVGITITSETPISSVKLFFDINNSNTFSSVNMNLTDGNTYECEIPIVSEGSTISYFVQISLDNGIKVLTNSHSFYAGADMNAPIVEVLSNPIRNTINAFGISPFYLTAQLSDNIGIDTSTAVLTYWVNENSPEIVNLEPIGGNKFQATFAFDTKLNFGDYVSYFFAVNDKSANSNLGTSDTTTYFIDTTQVIDDFELNFFEWETNGTWNLSSTRKSGSFSMTDSPDGDYSDNENSYAKYLHPFNLSIYAAGNISYAVRSQLAAGDSLFLELSNDNGNTWHKIDAVSQNSVFWSTNIVDITEYTGIGNEEVYIRFRLETNSSTTADGVFIDEISIDVTPDPALSINNLKEIPLTFRLSQNYPNPFNPSTVINFSIPYAANIELSIFNILGEKVKTLVSGEILPGSYNVNWNGTNDFNQQLTSGIYFYRLKTSNFIQTKKMILIR
jgi:subtilisin family serine protease